jgi:hypothetical protein
MKKLLLIPQDKANHFVYGFVIYVLASLLLSDLLSLAMVVIWAICVEIYDEYDYGGFDWKDLLVTMIPAILLFTKSILKL